MKFKTMAAVLVLAACSSDPTGQTAPARLDAFPGAEGFGRYTTGGRGGQIIKVTTLADSGPGSLRAAVEAEGPRIIVFEVDGDIRLASALEIRNGDITIAGQSAPGGGVTLRDHGVIVAADNVIIRYVRTRMGDESGIESDAIDLRQGTNIILDHVSASWANDETVSATQRYEPGGDIKHLNNVTVQWSIISESLNDAGHEKGDHGYGSLIQGSYGAHYSFHHNLWAHHQARMPRIGNYASITSGDTEGVTLDFRNNVFYNWGDGATTDFYNWAPGLERGYDMDPFYGRPDNQSRCSAGANLNTNSVVKTNFINNYYLQGADTCAPILHYTRNRADSTYLSGNTMDGELIADQWATVISSRGDDWRSETPFPAGEIETQTAEDAYEAVLARAGASRFRDAVDDRVIDSVRNRTGTRINSQADVGGWPELPRGQVPLDSDGDGIPDAWEIANGLDPNDPSDAAAISDSGYANIELYLNSLVE